MNAAPTAQHLRAETLVNCRVYAKNGRVVGRIQELRVQRHGEQYEVTAFVLGPGGLLERLAIIGRPFIRRRVHAVVARWDQIDLTQPDRPRLTCDHDELRVE
jgi:sporulation protein YlmC with PRC-barrel domain